MMICASDAISLIVPMRELAPDMREFRPLNIDANPWNRKPMLLVVGGALPMQLHTAVI